MRGGRRDAPAPAGHPTSRARRFLRATRSVVIDVPPTSASAQVSSRTRGWEVRVRLETCALARNGEAGSSSPAQHFLSGGALWRPPMPSSGQDVFAEMCILHSRMTVGTALSNAKCTFRRRRRSGDRRHGPSDRRAVYSRVPSGRRGARRGRRRADRVPGRGPRGRSLSKSVAKAPIVPERRKRIVDIPRFFSRPIPSRRAFATDSDTPPPRTVPGVPRVPPGWPAPHRSEPQRGMMRHITPVRKAHWSWKERAAAKTSLNRSAASASAGESSPSSGLAPMNQARTVCGESVATSSR